MNTGVEIVGILCGAVLIELLYREVNHALGWTYRHPEMRVERVLGLALVMTWVLILLGKM